MSQLTYFNDGTEMYDTPTNPISDKRHNWATNVILRQTFYRTKLLLIYYCFLEKKRLVSSFVFSCAQEKIGQICFLFVNIVVQTVIERV